MTIDWIVLQVKKSSYMLSKHADDERLDDKRDRRGNT